MVQKYVLETEGYRICFALQETQATKESADVVVELILDRRLGACGGAIIPTLMTGAIYPDLWRILKSILPACNSILTASHPSLSPWSSAFSASLGRRGAGEDDGEFSVAFS